MSLEVDTLTIDPLKMGIAHRFGPDSRIEGTMEFSGGVLVQGELTGNIEINGSLLIWADGIASGHIKVTGDVYLFGNVCHPTGNPIDASIDCQGTAYIASDSIMNGVLTAQHIRVYQGADIRGTVRSLSNASFPSRQVSRSPLEAPPEAYEAAQAIEEIEGFFDDRRDAIPVFQR